MSLRSQERIFPTRWVDHDNDDNARSSIGVPIFSFLFFSYVPKGAVVFVLINS